MRITVSLPDEVVREIAAKAAEDNRSVSNMIATLLQSALAEAKVK